MNRRQLLIGLGLGAIAARAVPTTQYAGGAPDAAAGYGRLVGECSQTGSRAPVGGMTQIFTHEFGQIAWWPLGDGFHDEWIGGCVADGRMVSIGVRP